MKRVLAGTTLVALIAAGALVTQFAQAQTGQTSSKAVMTGQLASYPAIDDARLRMHIKTLSDDFFEGRSPGTRGDDMATTYVAGAMAALGLEPAGDNGT